MENKNYNIVVFLFIVFLTSCNSKPEKTDLITIDSRNFIPKEIKLSDFGEQISYLKLSDDPFFGKIYHTEFSDDHIFISTDAGVLKYDYDGNFIRTIGQRGEGPEEYLLALTFTLDRKNEIIYILSRPHVVAYSFNGVFLSKRLLPDERALSLHYIDEEIVVPHFIMSMPEENPYLWTIIDTAGQVVERKKNETIHFEGNGITYNQKFAINLSDHKVLYWNHYIDTIYHISNKGAEIAYLWGDKSHRLTPAKVVEDDIDNCMFVRKVLETNHFLFIDYRINKKNHLVYLDKNNGLFYNTEDSNSIVNDLDEGLPFTFSQYARIRNKEYLIQWFYPYEILEMTEDKLKSTSSFSNMVDGLDEDDNLVIIMVEIR